MKIYNPQDTKEKTVLVIGSYDEWQSIIQAVAYAVRDNPDRSKYKVSKWKTVLKQMENELGVY